MLSDKKENIGHCSKIRPISFCCRDIHSLRTHRYIVVCFIYFTPEPKSASFFFIATGPLRFSLLTMLHKYTVRMIAIY